uniref:Uncharacterized protein n=1 Tax=Heterorhabditis bacteriophora TaxID=37862 RepID=A0A1I7W9I0_HETBA
MDSYKSSYQLKNSKQNKCFKYIILICYQKPRTSREGLVSRK